MAIRNALESASRWLARRGSKEPASSGAGGLVADEPPESTLETVGKTLLLCGVLTVYGPSGVMMQSIEARQKEAKEAKEAEEAKAAQDLPK